MRLISALGKPAKTRFRNVAAGFMLLPFAGGKSRDPDAHVNRPPLAGEYAYEDVQLNCMLPRRKPRTYVRCRTTAAVCLVSDQLPDILIGWDSGLGIWRLCQTE